MRYRVLIEADEDGVFVAEVPALPGCISQGNSRAEALNHIKEAIRAYLESLVAQGEPSGFHREDEREREVRLCPEFQELMGHTDFSSIALIAKNPSISMCGGSEWSANSG